jgi:16S rRNA (guanine(1405)-N(7))-methyltransferase
MELTQILKQVKSHKKYSSLADEIVLEEIKNYLKKNPDEKLNKLMIKEIRSNLHKLYSTYSSKKNKRNKLLEELRLNPNNLEIIKKILKTSVSAKERLDSYPKIYSEIFNITGKPKSILDLGCGLNPLSFPYMNLNQLIYHAYDIDEQDIGFLNKYFKLMKSQGLNGKAEILNVRDFSKISKLPSADIIFLWKIIDLIDINNHKPSEELIKILIPKSKFLVASFATRTITKKFMKFPNRKWFELMLTRIGLKYKTFSIKNEVFYVVWK